MSLEQFQEGFFRMSIALGVFDLFAVGAGWWIIMRDRKEVQQNDTNIK